MDIFLIAADDVCGGLKPIVQVIKGLFDIIRIIIPIALLIFGALDLAKAVIASDEKEIKGATNKFIKRAIAAVAVFFAVTLVDVVMGIVGKGEENGDSVNSTSWSRCWTSIGK